MSAIRLILNVLALGLAVYGMPARADFYIVVHASNPQRSLSHKAAVDLFMGRSRAFSNGDFALIFDLPRDDPRRAVFYQALTGLDVAQVNSYWARLMFSGQSVPPQAMPDEAAMVSILRRNPSALGWLTREPADPGLRTLLVLREPSGRWPPGVSRVGVHRRLTHPRSTMPCSRLVCLRGPAVTSLIGGPPAPAETARTSVRD